MSKTKSDILRHVYHSDTVFNINYPK